MSFEKTKSPEVVYLLGFFGACLFQSIKILVVFFNLWETSSNFLILLGRIELIGKILAPISLLFLAMFYELEQLQESDKNIGLEMLNWLRGPRPLDFYRLTSLKFIPISLYLMDLFLL